MATVRIGLDAIVDPLQLAVTLQEADKKVLEISASHVVKVRTTDSSGDTSELIRAYFDGGCVKKVCTAGMIAFKPDGSL